MEVSRANKNLSTAAVIVLLLIVSTAEMSCVEGFNYCKHLSGKYHGWCRSNGSCDDTCLDEDKSNVSGECGDLPPRCYCYTYC
ncbi:unnamed protein product [Urochloa decumbens]|uniref:Knottins-like domain-containing protein n=1 Tax=Urochloa decumbens TaxID=240449 RepID=A0ABC9AZ92_9POAL